MHATINTTDHNGCLLGFPVLERKYVDLFPYKNGIFLCDNPN